MSEQPANDFQRTVHKDIAFSTCLNCATSLMSAPAQHITRLEADHRIECETRPTGRKENRQEIAPVIDEGLIDLAS